MNLSILDTDILSAFLRGNEKVVAKVAEHVEEYGFINFSIITYYEIKAGLLYKDAKKQLARFQEFAEENRIILLTVHAVDIAADIEATLRKNGIPIGHTDVLIAGIATANDMQLITNNTAHFSRIKGLHLDNWI
jgi:predicted nucleic acid-binding protein